MSNVTDSLLAQRMGPLRNLKINVGQTIDKYRLKNSLAINGAILRFAYQKMDVRRRAFSDYSHFAVATTK